MRLIQSTLSFFCVLWFAPLQADVSSYFKQIKNEPNALYHFFKLMPKGGELHYHLAGGPSPETMLALVANSDYCLHPDTLSIGEKNAECVGINTKEIQVQSALYNNIIRSWSMEGFTPGNESGHDHFFNSFMKFMPIVLNYRPQLVANIVERAAAQHEQYLEIMDIADNAFSLSFGNLITSLPTFALKRQFLLQNKEFQSNVKHTINESDRIAAQAREHLGCAAEPQKKACQVKVKFLYYVLREQPLDNLFAQALNAFEAVSRSQGNLVGVNMVQAEDGIISMRDYQQQMRVFNYLHAQYPNVHIALHAGELTADYVAEKELTYHIQDALMIGKAQRIGHGIDIKHESKETINYMAQHNIPVEINLVSNQHILNIAARKHPLNYYLAHQVPVVLSTDDEGILRTNLTQQYVKAVLEHHLEYSTLRQINRNTLTYAFIAGESIWSNAGKAERIAACQDLDSTSCRHFIATSEKAQLQWNLEKKLAAFESNYR